MYVIAHISNGIILKVLNICSILININTTRDNPEIKTYWHKTAGCNKLGNKYNRE